MIINNSINFTEWDPYISTEETICKLLIRDKRQISDDYELMPYPLAHWINTIGIPRTQKIIDSLNSSKIRIFICQHIFVNKLKFKENDLVFTPHSSVNDSYYTIPHYAVNVDKSLIKKDKSYEFSFLGSTSTHKVRKDLVNMYDTCFDSNVHWGLDKGMSKDFNNNYIELLGDSKFSCCPRGTGISSVRLFESMSMGSIPIILADGYKPPLNDKINWSEISLMVNEDNICDIPRLILEVDYKVMKDKMINTYNKYFSNENLHKTVLLNL